MLLALVLSLVAPAAGLRLDWQAPAQCPDGAALRGRIERMIGAEATARADLQATGVVRTQGARWILELDLVRAGGRERRTLVDGECGALADAAALVIAVAIDPQARALEPEPPVPEDSEPGAVVPAPPGAVVPAPPGPVVPGSGGPKEPVLADRSDVPGPEDRSGGSGASAGPVVAVPEDRLGPGQPQEPVVAGAGSRDRSARRLQVSLRAGAGLGFVRVLPGVHAALDLGLALAGQLWRVELAGVFAPPVRTSSEDPAIGGVFRLGAGELRGCGVPGPRGSDVSFPLCVGLQVGAMHGRGVGSGLEVKQEARALWLATRVGPAVRWRPRGGRVGLWLGLDVLVALTRPAFETAGGVRVHEAARVGGQASLGVEVRLR